MVIHLTLLDFWPFVMKLQAAARPTCKKVKNPSATIAKPAHLRGPEMQIWRVEETRQKCLS